MTLGVHRVAFVLCLVWGHRRPPVARLLGAALVSEAIVGPFVHLRAARPQGRRQNV